jgi:hypothetical protein
MMDEKSRSREIFNWLIIAAILGIGLWLIVIRPLGPNLESLPGDLGDTRFNNYILEHDYRWITGQDPDLFNAPFFYPYPLTLAFSDNHFGSMLFYDAFRVLGLERESAFQGWYIFSFILNFGAAAYVLKKFNLKPLAVGLGAFFFTFGLPVLAQENHSQLAYRFCIPLACYALWQFSQKHQFKQLVRVIFWWVWQFYLTIYMGYFLSLLLVAVAVGIPFTASRSFLDYLLYWPRVIKQAWKSSKLKLNILYSSLVLFLLFAMIYLFKPYIMAANIYGLSRRWEDVQRMLPRWQSYLIADGSGIWKNLAFLSHKMTDLRWEHQLFVGISVVILLVLGCIWLFKSPHRKMAFVFLGAAVALALFTLKIGDFTLYRCIFSLPGANSIRAVTRIILVLMWPIAIFISIVADALLKVSTKVNPFPGLLVFFLFGLLVFESAYFTHSTFPIAASDERIQKLREQLPANLPTDPVLYVINPGENDWYATDLDAMLLSQDLNWPVMNGYSGNNPPDWESITGCDQAGKVITTYMKFRKIQDPSYYSNLISRLVVIGAQRCTWSTEMPAANP